MFYIFKISVSKIYNSLGLEFFLKKEEKLKNSYLLGTLHMLKFGLIILDCCSICFQVFSMFLISTLNLIKSNEILLKWYDSYKSLEFKENICL